MRATWPGARSGRISITTGPCVVSSVSVSSGLAIVLCLSLLAIVDEMECEGPPRNRRAETVGKRQWRTAADRGGERGVVDGAPLIGHVRRLIGDAAAENLAVAPEAEHHSEVHAGADI